MAEYRVTTIADTGAGSLRQAITDANNNPGLDNIVFEVINVELNSAILISDSIDLTGNGAVITQTTSDRLFNISDGDEAALIDVTFNNLQLKGGKQAKFAGAINTLENLTLNQVTVEGHSAAEKGGAIASSGASLTINDSSFRNNSLDATNPQALGSAIYIDNGILEVKDSSFETNNAAGAIALNQSSGNITNSSAINNQGLAILAQSGSSLNIEQSDISDNLGGGITIENSSLTMTDSSANNNQAQSGAAINVVDSEAKISNSIFLNNVAAADGGAIKAAAASQLDITNSTLELNEAPLGSAISLDADSSALLLDTTVIENVGSEEQLEGGDFTVETTPVIGVSDATLDLADVHRFYQFQRGFHLYTSDTNEVRVIREQSDAGALPYSYESEQFTVMASDKDSVSGAIIEGAKPVYRFFNTSTGAHLYTMDENERGFITANLDNYNFEGIQYYAFEDQPQDIETVPVFRLYNGSSGSHLFTIDQNEVDFIKENLPQFSVEGESGIAYHVFELEF